MLTKISTTYGADMEPSWDMAREVPMAVFLLDVGNSSEVCKMITANTAESANLPSNATTIISVLLSGMKKGLVNILFFYFHYFMLTLI